MELFAIQKIPTSARSKLAIQKHAPILSVKMEAMGLTLGNPIFIRVFKKPGTLELWVQGDDGRFKLFRQYPICTFSGELGPKLQEGDRQSPEGFYYVTPQRMNPSSRFHLSFNLGYPNQYDRAHNRTGSFLMVHGDCVSIGCYAMTDKYIEEIYTIADAAFKKGSPFFRVHAFPFPLDENTLVQYKNNPWYDFWKNLQQGYQWFEKNKRPPDVNVENKRYTFSN
ncbi:L,D-transpeptidase family protein [Aliikangiella coralliicola]|uniref:L,D-transpeptidase family protein n=1 Tax=Aliikangiella coralliicola TaxID=2592383 RepID=UPI001AF01151|nr:murein L,D-transpeptidase family protein [Aliikangiella coralliicola]